jgi:hypothetical protein
MTDAESGFDWSLLVVALPDVGLAWVPEWHEYLVDGAVNDEPGPEAA